MLSVTDLLELAPRVVAAFVIGAVPFAWLIVRLCKGIDVRTLGSGNVGATNASRAFDGKGARIGAFLAVYLLDAGKGACAAWLGSMLGLLPGVLCAAAGILGHVFTPFLGGRGGKGVATASGALAVLDWRVTLIALGVFFLVRFTTGQVFFGSLALGLGLAGAAILVEPATAFDGRLPLTVLSLVIALFLFWTHRSNLKKFFAARQS
ncbi:MAG: glycerol-3-phosphate acyltransferase [Planctomycetes bacterium]|nr:glycerol-3-phosphate acyltransferase [Planctomycetota bacterium]